MNYGTYPPHASDPYAPGVIKGAKLLTSVTVPEPTVRTLYEFPGSPKVIEFVSVENTPGFTHRAIADGKPCGWLSDEFRPSKATAKYFWLKAQGLNA